MYFERVDAALDPVSLEQAAALCATAQPVARDWLASHLQSPGALLCIGREGSEVLALSAGVLQPLPEGGVLVLHELCIAARRRSCGLGAELLAFTLRSAALAGATTAIATETLAAGGGEFLAKNGFSNVQGNLCRSISLIS